MPVQAAVDLIVFSENGDLTAIIIIMHVCGMQIVFCNAGYLLTGFFHTRYGSPLCTARVHIKLPLMCQARALHAGMQDAYAPRHVWWRVLGTGLPPALNARACMRLRLCVCAGRWTR